MTTTPAPLPPPLFVAWTESLRPDVNPLDRINIIVEQTEYNAGLSLYCEIEESGPEVGKPATSRVLHPVTRYVPEAEMQTAIEAAVRAERERVLGEVLAYVTGPIRNQFVNHTIHPGGLQLKDIYDDVRELCRAMLKEEAAKGQAK